MTLATASTPAMGWNSWNAFRCYDFDEQTVLDNADKLLELGLFDVGYDTVVVDDGWQAALRNNRGELESCPKRFPHGMKWLGEELHARGLKFGLYLAPGRRTCAQIYDAYGRRRSGTVARKPSALLRYMARVEWLKPRRLRTDGADQLGSWQHEEADLAQLVDWGVDYLKYDWCKGACGTGICEREAFERMSQLVKAVPRELTYSISEYGTTSPWQWAPQVANSWRTTADIMPNARSIFSIARASVEHTQANRPGAFGDPDMLHVGNLRSASLARSHMRLWGMFSSPLMIGTDLRKLTASSDTVHILKDRAALELNQALEVTPTRLVASYNGCDVYSREFTSQRATLVVNTSRLPRKVELPALESGWVRDWAYCDARELIGDVAAQPGMPVRLAPYASLAVFDTRTN